MRSRVADQRDCPVSGGDRSRIISMYALAWARLSAPALAGRVPPREPPREMATGGRRGDGAARSAAAAAAVAAAGPAAICNGLGEPLSASLRARARAAPAWLSMLATIPVAMPRACPVNLRPAATALVAAAVTSEFPAPPVSRLAASAHSAFTLGVSESSSWDTCPDADTRVRLLRGLVVSRFFCPVMPPSTPRYRVRNSSVMVLSWSVMEASTPDSSLKSSSVASPARTRASSVFTTFVCDTVAVAWSLMRASRLNSFAEARDQMPAARPSVEGACFGSPPPPPAPSPLRACLTAAAAAWFSV
mmetsp:Transcript_2952/g.8654  ORF Transcript_2952/g.8654 Transcript_2952/m.8654 type:complete len:304 (-) Transcript_2952:1725-2636(-)